MDGFQYCARYQRTSGNTTAGFQQLFYTMETRDSIPLAGKTVTLSFYARAGANFSASANALSLQLRTGTLIDQSAAAMTTNTISQTATLTTSWQRFSYTATIPSTATGIGINLYYLTAGTAGANDYFEVTGVQVEAGAAPTEFRRNAPSLQAELAACQRYYQRFGGTAIFEGYPVSGPVATGGIAYLTFPHAVPLRANATSIEFSSIGINIYGGAIYAVTGATIAVNNSGRFGTLVAATGSGFPASSNVFLSSNNNINGFIALNAEL
jgi:hypothetical protein